MRRKIVAWAFALLLLPQLAHSLATPRSSRQVQERCNRHGKAPPRAFASSSSEVTVALASRPRANSAALRAGGDRYGAANNSTIPTPEEAAAAVGVEPCSVSASKKTWQRVWRLHGAALPVLHAFDSCRPKDSSLSLRCLWLKALSGNDASSPAYDDGLTFDLLPPVFRSIVGRRVRRWYPRLHHANIEMRTAFLDRAVGDFIASLRASGEVVSSCGDHKVVRLVTLGAGYDVRSVKFIERDLVSEAFELDLPEVVEAKQMLLGPRRLLRRRPWLKDRNMPKLINADLNKTDEVRAKLEAILNDGSNENWRNYYTIFVFEGVMIYLDEGIPSKLLEVCSSVLKENGLDGSLCFADRLENSPGGDKDLGRAELARNGWELVDWSPKPGLARHMGSARLLKVADD